MQKPRNWKTGKPVQSPLTEAQFARWAGKRYIVLVEVKDTKDIQPFAIDRSNYGNMDDWLPVGKIENVKK